MFKRWKINEPDRALAIVLSNKLSVSPVTAQILINRGFRCAESSRLFLNPMLKDLRDPFLLKDMDRAVERVIAALEKKEKIIVHGDYDVDGVTAAVLLTDFLKKMGGDVDFILPARADGYGLKSASIKLCAEKRAKLLITVDCGISSAKEIAYAAELGIDVIVTDHHEPDSEIPKCLAVINPKRPDSGYTFKDLAGVGVAFKLAHAVLKKCRNDSAVKLNSDIDLRDYIDLVCLGTIADVVPLVDENRIIVKAGLQKINDGSRRGIRALKDVAGLDDDIEVSDVAFKLAPRINATGRVSLAYSAAMLLLSGEEEESARLAMELDSNNRERQKIEGDVLKEAFSIVENRAGFEKEKIIVVAGEKWHHGVIGIVASRLVKRFNRPAVVISFDESLGKGSARSIKNFNILDALRVCKEDIFNLGGHAGAAGMSINKENLERFAENLGQTALNTLSDEDLIPEITSDIEIRLDELTYDGVKELERLEPFGFGNPKPVFLSKDVAISRTPKLVGSDHLKMFVDCMGMEVDVIGFGMAGILKEYGLKSRDRVDMVYTPTINRFRGEERLQLELCDLRLSEN